MQNTSWRSFPALIFTALYVGGTFITGLPIYFSLISFGLCVLGACMYLYMSKHVIVSLLPLYSTFLLAIALTLLGVIRKHQVNELPTHHLIHKLSTTKPEQRVLRVEITDFPQQKEYGWKFVAAVNAVQYKSGWKPFTGTLQVTLVQDNLKLQKGDFIEINGYLSKPIGKRNPMDFDYAHFLAQKGIYGVFSSKSAKVLYASTHFITQLGNTTRQFIKDCLSKGFKSQENKALMFALLVGDRSEVDVATTEQFRATGLMHLLAVSGLHIFLLGMIIYELLRTFLNRTKLSFIKREYLRSIITILVLVIFWIVTGNSPSILRAIIMALIAILANLWQRPNFGLNALGLSAFILLVYNPNTLFDVGFQLSYAAVLALMLLYPVLNDYFTPERFPTKWIRSMMHSAMISVAATLGTLPIMLFHFGTVSLGGILLNIIGVPLSSVALIAGLLSVLAFTVSEGLGMTMSASAELFTSWFKTFTQLGFDYFGWMQIQYYVDNLWIIVSILALLFSISLKNYRKPFIGLALLCITINSYGFLWNSSNKNLKVLFFDVGHGDAALIQFPNGKTMLVDAGDCNQYIDMGKSIIVPHFKKQNIKHIDAVLITHPHADHIGGLSSVLRGLKVSKVFMNGDLHDNAHLRSTLKLADSLSVPIYGVKEGDNLSLDTNVQIKVLASYNPNHENINDGSIVFNLSYGRTKFLFTGDAEAASEAEMVEKYPEALGANVIKVGHHGSNTSSTAAFVHQATSYTKNEYAIVSVSAEGKHGLPDYTALKRWGNAGATVLQTANQQAIWLQSDGLSVSPIQWKK